MARYKVIQRDYKRERYKKRERIHFTVNLAYVIFMVIGVIVGGINQGNTIVTGLVLLIMGLGSLPVALFYTYMLKKGWRPLLWFDDPQISYHIKSEVKEQEISSGRLLWVIMTFFLFLFSVSLPICGILRLLGIL